MTMYHEILSGKCKSISRFKCYHKCWKELAKDYFCSTSGCVFRTSYLESIFKYSFLPLLDVEHNSSFMFDYKSPLVFLKKRQCSEEILTPPNSRKLQEMTIFFQGSFQLLKPLFLTPSLGSQYCNFYYLSKSPYSQDMQKYCSLHKILHFWKNKSKNIKAGLVQT